MLGKWSYIQIPLFICGIKYSFIIWTILVQEKSTLVNNLFIVRFNRNWYRICCNNTSADSKTERWWHQKWNQEAFADWLDIYCCCSVAKSCLTLIMDIYIKYRHTHTYISCIYVIYIYIYINFFFLSIKDDSKILEFWQDYLLRRKSNGGREAVLRE